MTGRLLHACLNCLLEVLESTAESVINAKSIGKVSVMPDTVIEDLCTAFNLK